MRYIARLLAKIIVSKSPRSIDIKPLSNCIHEIKYGTEFVGIGPNGPDMFAKFARRLSFIRVKSYLSPDTISGGLFNF